MRWTTEQQTRLNKEREILSKYFPSFTFTNVGDRICLEGSMTTNQKNQYKVRLYVPGDMPNSVPEVVIVFPTPITNYSGHNLLDYGYSAAMHLLSPLDGYPQICTYQSSHWNPNKTFYLVLMKVRIWLEAFDGHKDSGKTLDYYLKHQQ